MCLCECLCRCLFCIYVYMCLCVVVFLDTLVCLCVFLCTPVCVCVCMCVSWPSKTALSHSLWAIIPRVASKERHRASELASPWTGSEKPRMTFRPRGRSHAGHECQVEDTSITQNAPVDLHWILHVSVLGWPGGPHCVVLHSILAILSRIRHTEIMSRISF